jgi:hypothetical protein
MGEETYIIDIVFYTIEPHFMIPSILVGSPAMATIVQRHLHISNNFYSSDNDAYMTIMDNFNQIISKDAIYDLSTHIGRCDPATIGMHTRLYDYQINDLNKLIEREIHPLMEVFTSDKVWMCENGLIFNYNQSKFIQFDELRSVPIKGIVLAHQPGTGKSLIVLTYCHLRPRQTAIVVPDHLYASGHWDMEICKHFIAPDKLASHVTIFSFTQFSQLKPAVYNSFEAIFVDEAHEIYTPNDQDNDTKKKMKRKLLEILTSTTCQIKCLITGTPFAAGCDSMYNIICMLTDVNDPSKPYKFHYTPFIRNRIYEPTLEKLFSRNTLETVNKELNLPPANFNNVLLKLTQFEREIMDSLLAANINGDDIDPTKRYSKYVDVEKLRRILSNVMTAVLSDEGDGGYINLTVSQVKEQFLEHTRSEYEREFANLTKLKLQLHRIELIKGEIELALASGHTINMAGIMAILRQRDDFNSDVEPMSIIADDSFDGDRYGRGHRGFGGNCRELSDIEHNINHYRDMVRVKANEVESKKAVFDRYSKIYSVIEEATERDVNEAMGDDDFSAPIDYEKACPICASPISCQIALYDCGHFFCKFCSDNVRKRSDQCPCCRRRIPNEKITIISKMREKRFYGTKINYIIDMMNRTPVDEQFVIFTQFDGNIKALSAVLSGEGITTVVYRGWEDIADFRDNRKKVIILSSVNQPSGLDLSFVSQIIIMEPPNGEYYFRRDMERQIIGRILRIKQTKPVVVTRLVIDDSIEKQLYIDL